VHNSINEQDVLDAQSTAKTGMEFAKLLLNLNTLAVQYQNNPLIPLPKNLFTLVNGQPIGSSNLSDLKQATGLDLSKVIAPEILRALKVVPGYFVLKITSENSKFNLNLLQSRSYQSAQKALLRIFSVQDSQDFLRYEGYTPQQLVDNLSSYIKISVTDGYLQASTQSFYDAISAKYLPKHAALESLEELHRIPGFNVDDIYNMYSPYFTVWPIAGSLNTLNINTAPTELLAPLLTPVGQDLQANIWDKFDDYRVSSSFSASNMPPWLQNNVGGFSVDKDGADFLQNIFGTTDTIFRVESRGVVNGVEKTWVAIFQQSAANSSTNTPPAAPTPPATPTPPTTPTPPASSTSSNSSGFQIVYSEWL